MNEVTQILLKYSSGEATLEETNEALEEANSPVMLDPDVNRLTEEDIAATSVGATPADANGWGLLDTGTGYKNKVRVENGKLTNCGCGNMFALCVIGGKLYEVKNTDLVEYTK